MTGSGTQADPYIISDATDLQAMENDLTAYYELGGNIDASATSSWNSGAGFAPIGDSTNKFTGHFDGKEYTISDLTINRSTTDRIGLFGDVESTGSAISNVGITGSIIGKNMIGALVGAFRSGNIDGCSSTASVSGENQYIGGLLGYSGSVGIGTTITNCYSTGSVTGRSVTSHYSIGGLIGALYETVSKCYSTGNVTANAVGSLIGGFAGRVNNGAIVSKCYATGDVSGGAADTGGFAGSNLESITDCYAKGNVSGNDDVGGFVGDDGTTSYVSTTTNCYSTGTVSGSTDVGGFVGKNTNSTITGCFWDTDTSGTTTSDGGTGEVTEKMKMKSTFTEVDWDFNFTWSISATVNSGYPFLGQRPVGKPGFIWIDGSFFHYLDEDGYERRAAVVTDSDGGEIDAILGAMDVLDSPLDGGTL